VAKKALVVLIGVVLMVIGVGYYLGWFSSIPDLLPWHGDKGDLKVVCYDGKGTEDTGDDVPLANVTVKILSTELVKKTDENGTALFKGIEVGTYEVIAEYNSEQLNKTVTIKKDELVNVTFVFNGATT